MKIRPASAQDANAIACVHVESWQRAYAHIFPSDLLAGLSVEARQTMWAESIAKAQLKVLVAEVNSKVVGFAVVGPSRDEDATPSTYEVWAIYLSPSHWSAGLGRELWLASRNLALSQGAAKMTLWVIANNDRAITFYKAAGFEVEPNSLKSFVLGGVQVQEIRYVQRIVG